MSSESNHIEITRTNYEEYFLLYIDNELSASERSAVEAFALLHPDLAAELELLQGTRLQEPPLHYENKEALLAEMQEDSLTESLLLYMDDELDPKAREALEKDLADNASTREQYGQWLRTRLQPADEVVFPAKETLYRGEKQLSRAWVWRAAAVLILLAGLGTYYFQPQPPASGGSLLATKPSSSKVGKEASKEERKPERPDYAVNEPIATAPTAPLVSKSATAGKKEKGLPAQRLHLPVVKPAEDLVAIGPPPAESLPEIDIAQRSIQKTTSIEADATQETISSPTVTLKEAITYINSTPHNLALQAPDRGSERSQGSVRGLLRKATRFIEHRTGINPVNDDNQLLVGAIAITL